MSKKFKVGDLIKVREPDPTVTWVPGYEVVEVGLYGQVEPFRGPSDLIRIRQSGSNHTELIAEYNAEVSRFARKEAL